MPEETPPNIGTRLQRFLMLSLPAEPLDVLDLERYEDLPDRRRSLRAEDSVGLSVFAGHSIAKKLYRCPCCTGDIPIGAEHVIFSRIRAAKSESHHHVDRNCFSSWILPRLVAIQIVPKQETSAAVLNKKMRRARSQQRRQQR